MPRRNPKRIGWRLAGKFKALRKWKHSWDLNPDGMERARAKNVAKAHDYYRGLIDGLRNHVSQWPSLMTSKEFLGLVRDTVPLLGKGRTRNGYNWRSFRSRLVRLNLCTFDVQSRLWTNRCKPTIENSPDSSTNVGE